MFQNFDPVSDRSFGAKHVPALRAELKSMALDGFIIPHDDEYQNEYIPAYAERLMWATGFSGSAGAAIIMADRAVMLTDGRYTIQVREQVDDAFFDFADITETSLAAWIISNARPGERIGYDPMLHTAIAVEKLNAAAISAGAHLIAVEENAVDKAWTDQPAHPLARVSLHDTEFAGVSSAQKRRDIGAALKSAGADAVLLTAPPSIAWLFNIRGGDVERTPLPLSRAVVKSTGEAILFVNPEKTQNNLAAALGDDVNLQGEDAVESALISIGKSGGTIAIDEASAPSRYWQLAKEAGAVVIHMADPCALPRAAKNETEIAGARAAHIRDGVAVTRFLQWLDETAHDGSVDEIGAAKKLEEFRVETGELVDISFDSISGSGPNGAICHYRVTTPTNRHLKPGELFLIDSGGQYRDGTTDITRTIAIGSPSEEMRERFTLVLKSHIALATARFPVGTTGHQLDAFARRPLWEAGLDYDHGTGHGVGSFLGVHEGPQRIAKAPNDAALLPGMILSNEPGYYKTDAYGIRIENLIVVTPPQPVGGGDRDMMAFETITKAPLDRNLIDVSLLNEDEVNWVNMYHSSVWDALNKLIPDESVSWLREATLPL
ncbi:MAG: aminopeptidase P family protein [Parvularculaceae bacterium]|nr:MAG: aminopeptidase P family protein [Parvularculaceae bacterium]